MSILGMPFHNFLCFNLFLMLYACTPPNSQHKSQMLHLLELHWTTLLPPMFDFPSRLTQTTGHTLNGKITCEVFCQRMHHKSSSPFYKLWPYPPNQSKSHEIEPKSKQISWNRTRCYLLKTQALCLSLTMSWWLYIILKDPHKYKSEKTSILLVSLGLKITWV